MNSEEISGLRKRHLLPSAVHYYREPLHIAKASMQWVWDVEGKRYLDAIGGIVTISAGHNHPRIKRRLLEWIDADRPQHTTLLYFSEPVAQLAGLLAGIAPEGLRRCAFTGSGSEANELAILLARQHTKRQEIIALRHAYHGGTSGALSLVGQHTWKWGGPGLGGVHHAAQPNCYRCPFGATPGSCAYECADDVEETIKTSTQGEIAAMIVEPIQGVGGFVAPPGEYFRRIREIVKRYGGLLISDEVQTGMGRTGRHWFGILHSDVVPDIVTLAKGLGNGAPIGAVLTRNDVSESMRGKTQFSTFGGDPWAAIQAAETLSILLDGNVLESNAELGAVVLDGLRGVQEASQIVGDVRGKGLLIGMEIVKDRKTKVHGRDETAEIMEEARSRGLLVGRGGLYGNVIRVAPPMCITMEDAGEIVRILAESVQAVESELER